MRSPHLPMLWRGGAHASPSPIGAWELGSRQVQAPLRPATGVRPPTGQPNPSIRETEGRAFLWLELPLLVQGPAWPLCCEWHHTLLRAASQPFCARERRAGTGDAAFNWQPRCWGGGCEGGWVILAPGHCLPFPPVKAAAAAAAASRSWQALWGRRNGLAGPPAPLKGSSSRKQQPALGQVQLLLPCRAAVGPCRAPGAERGPA